MGWGGIGQLGDECSVNGGMGKDICPNFLQALLENIDRRSCNDGRRELIPVFHNPRRKCRHSPSAVARTLLYLVRVPRRAGGSIKIYTSALSHKQFVYHCEQHTLEFDDANISTVLE